MKILGKPSIPLFLAAVLAACNTMTATPTISQEDLLQTAISTVSTAFAETQRAMPTATPGPRLLPTISFFALGIDTLTPSPTRPSPTPPPTIATFTPLVFSDPSIPLSRRIMYYHPVWAEQGPVPEGTIHAIHLFAPAYIDETFTADTAADLRRALEIILHEDSRRIWDSSALEIVEITFRSGHAQVVIEGQALAAGDAQPCAASLQILMTVFANPSVQTAKVTLNGGGPITNRCFFGPPTPPIIPTVNDVYTRAAVESYMEGHAYVPAGPTSTPTP